MNRKSDKHYQKVLWEGIRAVKDGSKNLAWALLKQAIQINPNEATPWLWLAEATDDPAEKISSLEKALSLDPRNVKARNGLEQLIIERGNINEQPSFDVENYKFIVDTDEPVVATPKRTFSCSKCGAPMEYDLELSSIRCLYCGFSQLIEEGSAADDEQVVANVLTRKNGHSWAAAQLTMLCGRCGANSLWPPGQTAAECPYCGSHHLLHSEGLSELIDPQGIAVMQINETQAIIKIVEWLGKGWTVPDDLNQAARKSVLRPAYYPFWTFDGILEINWSCYVRNTVNRNNDWVPRDGLEYEIFDDVLIPGLKSIKSSTIKKLGKYNLKDVVDYKPDYLAGWPTLTYDRPLSEATLLARERVVRKVRRELQSKILPGVQKRGIRTRDLKWQNMTFKLILLPVWFGYYQYKGKSYPVMINGQLGNVADEKPKDKIKVIGLVVAIIATIIVFVLIATFLASEIGLF